MRRTKQRQQGVAIITVLLVIAIVAAIAVKMSGQLRYQLARTSAHESSEQAYWHWLSAEALAQQVLLGVQEEEEGKVGYADRYHSLYVLGHTYRESGHVLRGNQIIGLALFCIDGPQRFADISLLLVATSQR